MSAYSDLLEVAYQYRVAASRLPEEATRLHYDPQPLMRELIEKAELYEACANDVKDLPEAQAQDLARRFRFAMWKRDEPDDPQNDDHP